METIQLLTTLQDLTTQITELKKSKSQAHRSDDLKDLFGALAKAQAEMPMAVLSNQNPYFKTRYADLAAIVKASRPALTKYGLSIIQQLITDDSGHTALHTLLAHSSGQWIESRVRIVPAKSDVQSMGSHITYLRRYSVAALCGIVASDEDDDAELVAAQAREAQPKPMVKNSPEALVSTERISADQLQKLEAELAQHPDIATLVRDTMQISSLAAMPKSKYVAAMNRIRSIKATRPA